MKKNKWLIPFLILAGTFFIVRTDVFAAGETPPKAPSKNEVVVVFSLKVQPQPDTEFFAHYAKMSFSTIALEQYGSGSDVIMVNASNARQSLQRWVETDADGYAMLYFSFASGKRYIDLEKMQYYFAGSKALFITIPLQAKIEVPADVRYVYIGDFVCKCSKPFYDITDVKRLDNFDAAAKAVKDLYGKDAELERVPLIFSE